MRQPFRGYFINLRVTKIIRLYIKIVSEINNKIRWKSTRLPPLFCQSGVAYFLSLGGVAAKIENRKNLSP